MQPGQQHDHRVEQPGDGVGPYALGEQGPIGQRELEVPGDQDRVERLTGVGEPAGDHADRLHRRRAEAHQVVQQAVLVHREVLDHLLGGIDLVTDPDEPDDVTGDASGKCHEVFRRPLGQRNTPGKRKQPRIGVGGEESRHGAQSSRSPKSRAPGRAGLGDPQAGALVEDVDVGRARREAHPITALGAVAGEDPGRHRAGLLVGAERGGDGSGVEVRVGPELLDDLDGDLEAPVVGGQRQRLGADPQGDPGPRVGPVEDLPGHRDDPVTEGDATVDDPAAEQVHRRGTDEAGHEEVAGGVVEGDRAVDLLQDPVGEHRDPVTERHRLDLVVGDVDGRHPQAGLQRGDLRTGRHPQLGVQVRQRLVHQEHLGLADDRPAHRDPLPLTTGQGLGLALQVLLQTELLGRGQHPGLALLVGDVLHLEREAHVVRDGHVRVERIVLEDHRDVAILGGQIGDLAVPDPDGPPGHLLQTRQHAQGGRLAGPRRAHQYHELPVADLQVQPVDGRVFCAGIDAGRFSVRDSGHDEVFLSTGRYVPDGP
ncbi:hypothetical protein SDC9_88124 [bioreactor metagenome]|uniref:Uncharacterized protein n=1 Tax=bioreactor metagenome TaxID=1076179 RepID=A0A644ZKR6_9ZZZZ